MRVPKIIFTILAGASLGLAIPAHQTLSSSFPIPTIPAKPAPSFPTHPNSSLPIHPTTPSPPANTGPTILDVLPNKGEGLSKDCAAALLTIITSPEFLKCVPLAAVIPLTPIIGDPSIIANFLKDPAKNYSPLETPLLQSAAILCPAPKCSDAGVAGAVKALDDGCKTDLAAKNPFIELVYFLAVFYSPIHDSFCFTDKSDKKKFCWDETVLTAIGLPKSPITITGNAVLDAAAVADPPVICNDCNKDIFNTIANFLQKNPDAKKLLAVLNIDDKALQGIVVFFAVKCGIKFEDGKIP